MIYYFKPFSTERNLGKIYNDYCKLVPNDDDYICLLDGDVMFLTSNYGQQLEDIVKNHPEAGVFTCLTNRVGNVKQCYNQEISENPNILYHKEIAIKLQQENYSKVSELDCTISGHLMMFKKSVWNLVKFEEIENKLLSIDNRFSRAIFHQLGKYPILMEGVYVFHFYRFDKGIKDRSHLR